MYHKTLLAFELIEECILKQDRGNLIPFKLRSQNLKYRERSSLASLVIERKYFDHTLAKELSDFFQGNTEKETKARDVSFFLQTILIFLKEKLLGMVLNRQKLRILIEDPNSIVDENNFDSINNLHLNAIKMENYLKEKTEDFVTDMSAFSTHFIEETIEYLGEYHSNNLG